MISFWQDRRCFVTGCTGLLGSWLSKELVNRGANVVGLIRDWTSRADELLSDGLFDVGVVGGSIEDYPLIERTLAEYEIQTIFHLAAQTIVGVANGSPLSTFSTNICGTWNVLEAARRCVTKPHVIVASSDKAYGEQPVLPYTEDMPLLGRHPYDASKACADILAQTYHKTYGLPVCITRCANLFGGGDFNFNRLIPGTIRSVIRGERPVLRSDGKAVRDYLYVKDAVNGYILLAERMIESKELIGHAFNLSPQKPMSCIAVVNMILDRLFPFVAIKPIDVLGTATNEIQEQSLDSSKAKAMLGWGVTRTFESALNDTIDWYREYLK